MFIGYKFIVLLATTFLLSVTGCRNYSSSQPEASRGLVILERTEWTNQWVEDTRDTSLPRLLLIGDSHVQQYYPYVKRELEGQFLFGRFTSSKCIGNPYLVREIKTFLEQYPCDVLVFNNGLHGPEYPDTVYATALPLVLKMFKAVRPEAKIIWVNTTPRRNSQNLNKFLPATEQIKARNRAVKVFADRYNLPVVDLWSIGYEHPEYYSKDGTHFNEAGKKAEANAVSQTIRNIVFGGR